MFTNMLRKRESQVHLHEAQAAFRAKILHRQLVRAHAHPQEAGKANKTVYAFFLDVRKAYGLEGWAVRQVAREGVDGKLWRVLRDLAVKSTSQVRVNGDLSEAFPLSAE
jgi:hypothetical protein